MTTAGLSANPTYLRWFYVWVAASFVAITFGGFVATYWAPLAGGSLQRAGPALHLHALLFTAWPLFFLSQTWLAATGSIERHRAFGMLGIALVTSMLFVGVWVTIDGIRIQSAFGEFEARSFAIMSFSKLVLFVGLVAVAIAMVRRPEVHKRLMVMATLSIMQTAFARILFTLFMPDGSPQRPGLGPAPSGVVSIPTSVMTDLILLAIIIVDWRATKKLHPAYLIGGGLIVAMQILRPMVMDGPAWHAVANWLMTLAEPP